MATNGNNPEKISPRQRRAITALLSAKDVKKAAIIANVGARTLYRWLTLPEFKNALNRAESDLLSECGRRLIAGQSKALDVLESLMDDAEKESDQRLAAIAWLEFTQKFQELNCIIERLDALEQIVFNQQNGVEQNGR